MSNNKWIRKGDRVVVVAGNDKGKIGNVITRSEDRILIQGINIRKRHAKSKVRGTPSQIIEMEVPVHISNVALCSSDGKAVRVKVRALPSGEKELYYNRDGKDVVHRKVVKHS